MPYTEDKIGYQKTETSQASAFGITSTAATIRIEVYRLLKRAIRAMSSEQIAALLDLEYCSVQPRLSELRNDNLVRDSGQRAISRFGKQIIKWELNPERTAP